MRTLLAAVLAFIAIGAHAGTNGPVGADPFEAYPPSCLAWPIFPMAPTGPTYARSTWLASFDRTTMQPTGLENVDFTFWRVACDGGKSALLMRISRASNADRNRVVQFPDSPGLGARQASFSGVIRLAQEPNAQDSSLPPGALIPSAVTLVLENFYRNDGASGGALKPGVSQAYLDPYFDFNRALDVTIPAAPGIGISPIAPPLSIPAYDASQYAAASSPLPITGYNAGSYYDPAHDGEGFIVDIMGNFAGEFGEPLRAINLAWFTYDQAGRPYWLWGMKTFSPGATSLDVPMQYLENGAFAGASATRPARSAWGSVTVSFPDCGSVRFSYAASAGLPAPVPTGSGTRTWARLTQENGLSCR